MLSSPWKSTFRISILDLETRGIFDPKGSYDHFIIYLSCYESMFLQVFSEEEVLRSEKTGLSAVM